MKDIKIELTNDILELDLTLIEKVVLAMAKCFTTYGKYKCLYMSESGIAEKLGCSRSSISRAKDKLYSLGYIRIEYDKGNKDKIFYVNNSNTDLTQNESSNQGLYQDDTGSGITVTQGLYQDDTGSGITVTQHNNKEIKNNNNLNTPLPINNLLIEKDIIELGNTGNGENEPVKDRFNEILTTMESDYSDRKDWLYDNKKQAIDTMNSNSDLSDQQIKDWIIRVVEHQFGNRYADKEQPKKEIHKRSKIESDFYSNKELMEDRSFSDKYNSMFNIPTPGKDSMFIGSSSLKDRFDA